MTKHLLWYAGPHRFYAREFFHELWACFCINPYKDTLVELWLRNSVISITWCTFIQTMSVWLFGNSMILVFYNWCLVFLFYRSLAIALGTFFGRSSFHTLRSLAQSHLCLDMFNNPPSKLWPLKCIVP